MSDPASPTRNDASSAAKPSEPLPSIARAWLQLRHLKTQEPIHKPPNPQEPTHMQLNTQVPIRGHPKHELVELPLLSSSDLLEVVSIHQGPDHGGKVRESHLGYLEHGSPHLARYDPLPQAPSRSDMASAEEEARKLRETRPTEWKPHVAAISPQDVRGMYLTMLACNGFEHAPDVTKSLADWYGTGKEPARYKPDAGEQKSSAASSIMLQDSSKHVQLPGGCMHVFARGAIVSASSGPNFVYSSPHHVFCSKS